MKTILPLLFFGVVAGSCLVGAAGKLPAFTVERWVNSMPLTVAGLLILNGEMAEWSMAHAWKACPSPFVITFKPSTSLSQRMTGSLSQRITGSQLETVLVAQTLPI